ncbi:hypothetical protein GCM10023170_077220 [Phytohabitans houttuyneae]|uniref:Uncharacterized protein n=1 Tax=Phytohabitans houttuyneae TaxID=1076126 RepID=A0A6V8KWE0_9ACTN|nr:hypothetical protein Phou_090750 [Phytohabitans houttuyneae]
MGPAAEPATAVRDTAADDRFHWAYSGHEGSNTVTAAGLVDAPRPGWSGWLAPFTAALATAAVIWGVQALVVPARQAPIGSPAAVAPDAPLPRSTAGAIP